MINTITQALQFKQNDDDRGHFVVIEGNKDIPFEIKRIFYMYGSSSDVIRGQHANRKTEFVLINISGTAKVKVNDGKSEIVYNLTCPHIGLYLPKMVWKDMYDFSPDSILLVLASEYYDPEEYIRDFNAFLMEVQQDV